MDGELTYQAWATNCENELPKLLPCPFCGGEARTASKDYGDTHYWRVFCDTPSCAMCMTGVFHSEAEAIAAWNTRHHFGLTDEDYNILLDETGVSERTCKVIEMHEHVTMDEPDIAELSCGHDIMVFDMEPPSYCPVCGAKVVSE